MLTKRLNTETVVDFNNSQIDDLLKRLSVNDENASGNSAAILEFDSTDAESEYNGWLDAINAERR